MYRDRLKGVQILLSNNQAGPGRAVKQEQEEISPNHVQAFKPISVQYLKQLNQKPPCIHWTTTFTHFTPHCCWKENENKTWKHGHENRPSRYASLFGKGRRPELCLGICWESSQGDCHAVLPDENILSLLFLGLCQCGGHVGTIQGKEGIKFCSVA